MENYIYRDFSRQYLKKEDGSYTFLDVGFIGNIELDLMTKHRIQLQVEGLHENYPIEYPCGQAYVRIEVDPSVDTYAAIMTILDKITEDYQYTLRGKPYKDFVSCSETLAQAHPDLCKPTDERDGPYCGGYWMEFTRETLQYVDVFDDSQVVDVSDDEILLRGKVSVDSVKKTPEFVYDYPIVSTGMGQEYYTLTRGQCVWDVSYGQMYDDAVFVDPRIPMSSEEI